MAFCLAGALSFNLASPGSKDNRPVFAQLMLDEAFSKSDPQFAQQALQAFRKFGFQLVIVATVQNATTIQPYVDSVVMVSRTEACHSSHIGRMNTTGNNSLKGTNFSYASSATPITKLLTEGAIRAHS